jgi:hypothetical protein
MGLHTPFTDASGNFTTCIGVRYEIADPMIFALCDLVCGKMQRDARKAATLFGRHTD